MQEPESFTRLMRFAGKQRREVSNPCLTANNAIEIANYIEFIQSNNMTICKHKQLQRQCELCQAAESIKDAYIEGFDKGFEHGSIGGYGDDPMHIHAYPQSEAKVNSEST